MGMSTMWSLLGGMIILLRVFALGVFNSIGVLYSIQHVIY